jgi:hypothetical protein
MMTLLLLLALVLLLVYAGWLWTAPRVPGVSVRPSPSYRQALVRRRDCLDAGRSINHHDGRGPPPSSSTLTPASSVPWRPRVYVSEPAERDQKRLLHTTGLEALICRGVREGYRLVDRLEP